MGWMWSSILANAPIGATINFVDRNIDNVEKIETKLLDSDYFGNSSRPISVDSYVFPADDVAELDEDSVDYARYMRVFQQCGPGFAKELDPLDLLTEREASLKWEKSPLKLIAF